MYIKIAFKNGDYYRVPIEVIRKHKAAFYSHMEEDNWEVFERVINENLDDWAQKEMSWEDIKEFAEFCGKDCFDYEEGYEEAYFFQSEN
jgi:hypothetical protein